MSEPGQLVRLSDVASRVITKNARALGRVLTVAAGHGLVDQQTFFTKKVASEDLSNYWVVEPNDLVYNKSTSNGAPFGVVARHLDSGPGVVTPLYIVFRADPSRTTPEFLELACNSSAFFDSLSGTLREGARSHGLLNVRLSEFFSAKFPLPPIAEQDRIVDLIGGLDGQIAAIDAEGRAFRRLIDRLRSSLLEPAPHWERGRVADYATPVTGRAFPHRHQGSAVGDLPYVKVSDLGDTSSGRVVADAANWVTHSTATALKVRICPPGTVLFPMIGAAMLTEKRRVLGRHAGFDQNVMGLVPGVRITSGYLYALMSNIRLADHAQPGAVPSVNQSIVGNLPVAVPTLEEQCDIETTLDLALDNEEALATEARALRLLRAKVLSGLLTHEIVIPDAYNDLLAERM